MTQPARGLVPRATALAGLVAVAALVVLVLVAALPGRPVGAQTTTTTTAPGTTAGGAPAAGLHLVAQSGFVAPDGMFRVSLAAPPLPAGSTIKASIYAKASTSTIDQTAQGAPRGGKIAPDVTVPVVETVASDGAQPTIELGYRLAPSGNDPPLGFTLSQPGVYPVMFTLLDAAGNEQGRLITHLVRLPDGSDQTTDPAALTVALVVPLTAPVAHQPDGSIALGDDQAAALRSIVDTLNRHPSVPVSIVPSPETVKALTATDRSDTTPIGPALRTATSGGRQVIGGPFVSVPAAAWLDQGLADRYGQELTAGADQLRATLGAAPEPITASLDATTSAAVLSQLSGTGARQAVVPRDRLTPTSKGEEASTLTQTFDLVATNGDHVRTVATDSRLSARLTASSDPVLDAHEVLAALSLIALDTSSGQPCVSDSRSTSKCSRGVAIALPADAATAQPGLEALLSALDDRTGAGAAGSAPATIAGAPVLSPMTVNSLITVVDAASSTGSTGPSSQPRERQLVTPDPVALGAYPRRLEAAATQVSGFRSLLTPDDPTGSELARSLDVVVLSSGATTFDDTTRLAYLDGAEATVRSQTDQITSPEQQIVTLTSGDGVIPLSIANALPYPVQVSVTFASAKLEFPADPSNPDQSSGPVQLVQLPAGTSTPLRVHVRVRASGAFPLEVTVRSPDKSLAISSTKFTVRSTAVSGLGLVLTVIAGLFLLLWWGRHFRDVRRARRLVASTHPVLRGNGSGAAAAPGGPPEAISYAPADTD